jgi:alkanesulfonate monooxygenase SsuD/methylene tetrahydromethanopterin reductase-like flavin-dependent oxidoreductase (luciferase family)
MQFGIFDQNDFAATGAADFDLAAHYEARLRLAAFYDEAGFDRYHVSEHHATPLSATPATGAWLSAVAQRTRRIRFGPLVYILPLRHPLQVAEEVCLLDHLSGGRFELGVGRGVSPFELGYHGVAAAESPAMFAEALDLLLLALTQDEVTFEGRWWQCRDVPMVLRPLQRPHPPVWMPSATAEHATRAARQGVATVCNGPTARVAEIVARYKAEWTRPGPLPCLGLSRAIVIAETAEEARAVAQRSWKVHAESFLKLWRRHGAAPINIRMSEDFAEAEAAGAAFAGTPAMVRDALLAQVRETGCNYVVSRFAFGDQSFAEMHRSAALFAREVMPALRDHSEKELTHGLSAA